MTTIVYKDRIIAYDSRQTMGDLISDDDYNKMINIEGSLFFISGAVYCYDYLIKNFFGENIKFDEWMSAFVYHEKELFYIGNNGDGEFWIENIEMDKHHAIGSGRDFAYTALDMGATAKEAVKMAIKRDSKSGGKIRTVKL